MRLDEREGAASLHRWRLLWFVVLSYGISWCIWLLPVGPANQGLTLRVLDLSVALPWRVLTLLLGNLGPGIAAIVLTYYFDGGAGVAGVARRLVPSRANLKWCVLAALLPIALAELNIRVLSTSSFSQGSAVHWVRVFFMNILVTPLWEEIGWRGYLLPRLQPNRNGLLASLLIAPVWGIWHVPLYWGAQLSFIGCFAWYIIGLSVIFTWFYNKTRGSLAVVVVLHAAVNASTISLLGPAMNLLGIRPFLQLTALVCAVAIGIVLMAGTNLSYRGDMSSAQA